MKASILKNKEKNPEDNVQYQVYVAKVNAEDLSDEKSTLV